MKKLDNYAKYLIVTKNSSALRSAGYSASALLSAGYSASDLLSAGYSASDLLSAGYSLSAFRSAGYSASALRSVGYSAPALRSVGYSLSDLISAGYSLSDLEILETKIESIPVLHKPYTKLLQDLKEKKRILDQSDWGPDVCPSEENICKTPMCRAGHLVNMAGTIGYDLQEKYGWEVAATLIHNKTHPNHPAGNFGAIGNELSLGYIEYMAEVERKY